MLYKHEGDDFIPKDVARVRTEAPTLYSLFKQKEKWHEGLWMLSQNFQRKACLS